MIDEDRARPHAREGAVGSQCDGAQIIVVSYARENEIAPRGRLTRGPSALPTMLIDPTGCLGHRSVIDDDDVASGGEMPGHGKAHDAQT